MTFLSQALRRNHQDVMNMVVLSFLLHALILSIIFFSPSLPSPRWTFEPSYIVDLVSSPLSSVEVRSYETTPREVVSMNYRNQSMVMKKKVDTGLAAPVRETKTYKKNPDGNIDATIEGIKKRVTSSTTIDSHQSTALGHSEINIKMKIYYSVVWFMIKEEWALPEGILPDDNLETIIEIKILRNGDVSSLTFEKRSGNRYFDESAIKAIKKAVPLPPFPEWLDKRYIDLGIRFHSSEL
ncbi:MAG: energy transducer TonB [Thermodesulfobacteriota bacterium]|nr:energy transducer TonB [Thermodesulfobacteriota bacterium]